QISCEEPDLEEEAEEPDPADVNEVFMELKGKTSREDRRMGMKFKQKVLEKFPSALIRLSDHQFYVWSSRESGKILSGPGDTRHEAWRLAFIRYCRG
ncbi:MAG: hypothetical protein Q8O19_06900, partial [Rectinemataceae bacterium]|nr:hypothetical protein [Rectinemataceae bacterium]